MHDAIIIVRNATTVNASGVILVEVVCHTYQKKWIPNDLKTYKLELRCPVVRGLEYTELYDTTPYAICVLNLCFPLSALRGLSINKFSDFTWSGQKNSLAFGGFFSLPTCPGYHLNTVKHWTIVIENRVKYEIITSSNVWPVDCYVVVSIGSRLLVPKTQCMPWRKIIYKRLKRL